MQLNPDFAEAHNNLGIALKEQGKLDEAVACYRRAVELKPDFAACLGCLVHELQHLCRWDDLKALSTRAIEAVDRDAGGGTALPLWPSLLLALPTPSTAEQQLRCARRWVDRQLKAFGGPARDPARNRAAGRKPKITIGYLSANFHSHAIAWLVAELIEKHDRDRFAVFGYSYGPDDRSATRRRLVRRVRPVRGRAGGIRRGGGRANRRG